MESLANALLPLRIVKAILEVALLALAGQGIAWVMIRAVGQDPERNFFYRTLRTIVLPFTWTLRKITPKIVADRHIPWAALGLLLVGWFWVSFLAIPNTCHSHGVPIAECLRR